jgi:hypothetical protein
VTFYLRIRVHCGFLVHHTYIRDFFRNLLRAGFGYASFFRLDMHLTDDSMEMCVLCCSYMEHVTSDFVYPETPSLTTLHLKLLCE